MPGQRLVLDASTAILLAKVDLLKLDRLISATVVSTTTSSPSRVGRRKRARVPHPSVCRPLDEHARRKHPTQHRAQSFQSPELTKNEIVTFLPAKFRATDRTMWWNPNRHGAEVVLQNPSVVDPEDGLLCHLGVDVWRSDANCLPTHLVYAGERPAHGQPRVRRLRSPDALQHRLGEPRDAHSEDAAGGHGHMRPAATRV